jgi:Uma2 family endonuclease
MGRGGPGGWVFINEEEVHLGPHVTVPDIAGWRRERLPPGAAASKFFEVAPDWICELLSPSTEKYDKGDKRRIYALYGVPHLWHVDPRAKILEVFALQGKDWLLTHTFVDREDVCAPPFTEVTFSLGLLWPFDPPAKPKA